MNDFFRSLKACPALLFPLAAVAPLMLLLYLGTKCIDKLQGLWLRYRYPKETTMTHLERRALAAKRLAALKAGQDLYGMKPAEPCKPTQAMPEAAEARLIDRGLIAWWE